MAKTKYSHAFLVGSFNGELKPEDLDANNEWRKEIVPPDGTTPRYPYDGGYEGMCTMYYKAHLDAMVETVNSDKDRPEFLRSVHHYVHQYASHTSFTLHLKKGPWDNKVPYDYHFEICAIRLHFFPANVVLLSIEIDDTGTELDNLTAAHSDLMGYWRLNKVTDEELKKTFEKVAALQKDGSKGQLIKDGNKFKIFQTIEVEDEDFCDETLYEVASSSPIGCVHGEKRPDMKPSEEYFQHTMDVFAISAFDNWKGLALVDSFTMLGKNGGIRPNDCNFLYFPLIYLRCLFEKTFCFTRNNMYRMDRASENLVVEIADMEKYYFYDKISYTFLPNIIYSAIAKGLGIGEERDELLRQIKERAKRREEAVKEARDKKQNLLTLGLSAFAIFSVLWDLCSMFKEAQWLMPSSVTAKTGILVGIILLIVVTIYNVHNEEK